MNSLLLEDLYLYLHPLMLLASALYALSDEMVWVFAGLIGWLAPSRRGVVIAVVAFSLFVLVGLARSAYFIWHGPEEAIYRPAVIQGLIGAVFTVLAAAVWAWIGQFARRKEANVLLVNAWDGVRTWGRDK